MGDVGPAQERIELAVSSGATVLDLSYLQLEKPPTALRALTQLTTLDLSSNLLAALPDWPGELTRLTVQDPLARREAGLPARCKRSARPHSPILVVATHEDEPSPAELPDDLTQKYPKIAGVYRRRPQRQRDRDGARSDKAGERRPACAGRAVAQELGGHAPTHFPGAQEANRPQIAVIHAESGRDRTLNPF